MHDHSESLIKELQGVARQIRLDVLDMVYRRQAGHPGGSFSCAEILAALYFHHLKIDPARPDWPERDRVIMSKAHCCEAIYAALVELGMYPKETLGTYYCHASPFQGHADRWC